MENLKSVVIPRPTYSAELIEVIKTTCLIGAGCVGDPARECVQFWGKDGELLVTIDNYRTAVEQSFTPTPLGRKELRQRLYNYMFNDFAWESTYVEKICDGIMNAMFGKGE